MVGERWPFRLTAGYAISGLLTVFFATAGLYAVLVKELDRSTDLFLADKLNVLRTMLRERPNDEDALHEEIELESAARRYEQFYIRLLDDHGTLLMATPGMADQLDLAKFIVQIQGRSDRVDRAGGNSRPRLPRHQRSRAGGFAAHSNRYHSNCGGTSPRRKSSSQPTGTGSRPSSLERWWSSPSPGTRSRVAASGPSKKWQTPPATSLRPTCTSAFCPRAILSNWASLARNLQ